MASIQNGTNCVRTRRNSCLDFRGRNPPFLHKEYMTIQENNPYLPPSPVVPMFLLISNITNASSCVVTVTTAHSYVVGQLVRFFVPSDYGMTQINDLQGLITSIDVTNLIFNVAIDTTQFDVWITPSAGKPAPATISPAGSRNSYNTLNIPFHSLDGQVGN